MNFISKQFAACKKATISSHFTLVFLQSFKGYILPTYTNYFRMLRNVKQYPTILQIRIFLITMSDKDNVQKINLQNNTSITSELHVKSLNKVCVCIKVQKFSKKHNKL